MIKLFKSKIFKISFSIILFISVIVLLYKFIDFNFFLKKIKTINYSFLAFSVLSLIISYYFRVLRFKLILNEKRGMTLFSISGIHYFLNKILPARTGEISLPLMFKKYLEIDYSKGISALVFFRVLDIFVMLILFLFSLFFINIVNNLTLLIFISVFVIILIVVSWVFFDFVSTIFISILKKIFSNNKNKKVLKVENYILKIKEYRNKKNNLFIIKISFASLLSWIMIYMYYFFIVRSFELYYSFQETVFASSISNFTFVLPINSVGNVGPFEAAWGYGFHLLGELKDISVPIGLFANIFATIITSFIALFGFVYLKRKFSKNKE